MCATTTKPWRLPDDARLAARGEPAGPWFTLPCECPALEALFRPVQRPRAADWLACHTERGQTLRVFEREPFRAQPHATYRTIAIRPLGDFSSARCVPLDDVRQYVEAFFLGLDVHVDASVPLESASEMLLRTDTVLEWLSTRARQHTPRDLSRRVLCDVALTMADVYPDDAWNFVFGVAAPMDGVGVWSFARMDPRFPDADAQAPFTDAERLLTVRRSLKVLTHELGHIFGLKHCVYYQCLMNGSNHLDEMDSRPMVLCPVCLRKLASAVAFDPAERYRALAGRLRALGLANDAAWVDERLAMPPCE